jgi:hypothetical protein
MTVDNNILNNRIVQSFNEAIEIKEVEKVKEVNVSQIAKLAALSRYNVLKVSPGLSLQGVPLDNIEKILDILDEVVGAFTDQSKCERVREINREDAHDVMVSWLTELISYFGTPVLLDAEVILLTLSDFSALSMEFQYKYFENTLAKVRKWFKVLRKKLKPFSSPKA